MSKETAVDEKKLDVPGKMRRLTDLLRQMESLQKELAQAGFCLNENITVDQEKWNRYFGLNSETILPYNACKGDYA